MWNIYHLTNIKGFHSGSQQPCKFIGTIGSVCIRNEFDSHNQFGTKTWPPFDCFGTPICLLLYICSSVLSASNPRYCVPNPCKHGGSCFEEPNGHRCLCASDYGGENCELSVGESVVFENGFHQHMLVAYH